MNKLKGLCLLAIGFAASYNAQAQSEATFYTSMGSFTIDLTDSLTPITVDSFIARSAGKFYDGLTFHRVIDGFMIQGGDPNGNGSGGPGYTIPDEFHPSLKNVKQSLSMANAGPNTGGSQFFINLVDNHYLNNKHAVFGMVTSNFGVVQSIAKVPKGPMDKPVTPVVIDSIRITRFPVAVVGLEKGKVISIYPNPNKGTFSIALPRIATKVEVLSTSGQVIHTAKGKNTIKIDLKEQPAGIYIVRMTNAQGTFSRRILVQ